MQPSNAEQPGNGGNGADSASSSTPLTAPVESTAAGHYNDVPWDALPTCSSSSSGGSALAASGVAPEYSPTGPGGIPLPPSSFNYSTNPLHRDPSMGTPGAESAKDANDGDVPAADEVPPLLSNASMALAEFTSLLRPAESRSYLKEHIISLLGNVDKEDTLVRLVRELERNTKPEAARTSAHPCDSNDGASSRISPVTTVSESTAMMGSSSNHGTEGLGNFSFSCNNGSYNASRALGSAGNRGRRGSSSASANVPINIQESILRSHLERLRSQAAGGQSQPRRASHRQSAVSFTTDGSDVGPSSMVDENGASCASPTIASRRRSLLGAAALGLNLFNAAATRGGPTTEDNDTTTEAAVDDDEGALDAAMADAEERTTASSTFAPHRMIDPLEVPGAVPQIPEVVRKEGRRVAVSAAPFALGEVRQYTPKVIPKGPAEYRQLRDVVKACHLFAGLEDKDIEEVVQAMAKETYPAGASVLEQGQHTRDCLFLVTEGSCEAIKNGKVIGGVSSGGVFGELELMYKQAKCAATIRCITRCTLYTLDEESYRHAVMTGALQKRRKYEELTMQVPFLKCLPDYERMKIAEALVTKTFKKGQHVIRFGTKGTHLYFIVEGDVKVVGRNQGKHVEVVRLHSGDVVGELEFLFNHLTVADVVVTSRRLVAACISRHHFELILGPIQERLKEFVATSSTYEAYYLKEVANASVRSEISRAGDVSQRKQRRRVASSTTEGGSAGLTRTDKSSGGLGPGETIGLKNLDPRGEIILPAKRSLLHNFTTADLLDDKEKLASTSNDATAAATAQQLGETLAGADVGDNPLLFRFPFFPISADNSTIILGLREDGVVLSWNDNMAKLTSYPAEEVVGQNIYSFLLESHDQQVMYQAISDARNYAGDVEGLFADGHSVKGRKYTFTRSDGLTRAVVRLSIVPPLVSSGEDGADMLLAFGEEIKQCPHQIVDQSQWLASQVRAILADGSQTYEGRLQLIADAVGSYEATYRALTMSTEKLRVVNIRQMLGQVMMDFGTECVSRGLAVRQRFEGLETERAYLNAELLPECLRFATSECLAVNGATQMVTTVTLMEKNGLEFLVINFSVDGDGFSPDCIPILEDPLNELSHHLGDGETSEQGTSTGTTTIGGDVDLMSERRKDRKRLTRAQRQQLRRVREVVQEQGGTMRVQLGEEVANMFFLIPFLPAGTDEPENASVAESISNAQNLSMSTSYAGLPMAADSAAHVGAGAGAVPTTVSAARLGVAGAGTSSSDGASAAHLAIPTADLSAAENSVGMGGADTALVSQHCALHPVYNFTTLVAEDTPAHRNMLCSYLWERRHAVLPAYSLGDIDRLTGVADILFVDLHQSIISSLTTQDPIAFLREKARHMAIVITAKSFDDVSIDAYQAAGFITLKKPCTPVQAMQAIHKAEEKIFAHKQEAERIAQARETLAKNSRGAWQRGRLLGKGSYGEVFEAVDVLTGGKMAVKEMHLGKDNRRIEMFVDEVATMCNLQHPNIIHYFYCEQSSDLNVIRVFMEFAAGGTLQGLLSRKGKLPFKEFQSLLRDVTEGLAYIHSQNYVHCDIKTANVLLNHEGMGKIGDFGTARTLREAEQLYEMQGSPLYMSPECMSAGDLDEDGQKVGFSFATDVWSLGCVALEMATNKLPFTHIKRFNGPAGFTNYITSLTDTPDLSPLFDGPPSIIEFVSACLNPDPACRPTAAQLLRMSVFSEATDETTKSAVQALRRAQLLHVLNKFIAFEDPEDAKARLAKDLKYKTYRRNYCDFFDSSRSGSSTTSRSNSSHQGRSGDKGDGDEATIGKRRAGRVDRKKNNSSSDSSSSSSSGGSSSGDSSSDSDEDMMVAVKLPGAAAGAGGGKKAPRASHSSSSSSSSRGEGDYERSVHRVSAAHAPKEGKRRTGVMAAAASSASSRSSGSSAPSPSPDRPMTTGAEDDDDASPTPKKRSKTLSQPPARAGSPRENVALPLRRMALVDSDEEAAEAAFFDSSSSSSPGSPFGSGSERGEEPKAPAAVTPKTSQHDTPLFPVDPISSSHSSSSSPPPSDVAHPTEGKEEGTDARVQKTASSVSFQENETPERTWPVQRMTTTTTTTTASAASDGAEARHVDSWRRDGPPRRNAAIPASTAGDSSASLYSAQQPQLPQPSRRRPGGLSNTSFAPLLAASFIGRVAGTSHAPMAPPADFNATGRSAGSAVSAAIASVTVQSLTNATVNRNLSFYGTSNALGNESFARNVSFMGANMGEVLNDAANDFIQNLVSAPSEERGHGSGMIAGSTGRGARSRGGASSTLIPTPPISPSLPPAEVSPSASQSHTASAVSPPGHSVTEHHADDASNSLRDEAAAKSARSDNRSTTSSSGSGSGNRRKGKGMRRQDTMEPDGAAHASAANAEENLDLTNCGLPYSMLGMTAWAAGATVMTSSRVGDASAASALGNNKHSAGEGMGRDTERSPSPLPAIPGEVAALPAAAEPSSRLLDAVEVDCNLNSDSGLPGGDDTSSSSSSSSPSSSASSTTTMTGSPDATWRSSASSGANTNGAQERRAEARGPAGDDDPATAASGISDPNDVRLKIARRLRKAHRTLSNRSFFRIENLAGPLGNSMNTTSSHLTGLFGGREGSQGGSVYRTFTRSHTESGDGHGRDGSGPGMALASTSHAAPGDLPPLAQAPHHHHHHPPHEGEAPAPTTAAAASRSVYPHQEEGSHALSDPRPPSDSSLSRASVPSVTTRMLAAVLRPGLGGVMNSLARHSPDTPRSGHSGSPDGNGGGTKCVPAVVAPQPVGTSWLDQTVLTNPVLSRATVTSDEDSCTVPSVNFVSARSGDSMVSSPTAPRTPRLFLDGESGEGGAGNPSLPGRQSRPPPLPPPLQAGGAPPSASSSSVLWTSPQLFQATPAAAASTTTTGLPPSVSIAGLATVESELRDIAGQLKQLISPTSTPATKDALLTLPHPTPLSAIAVSGRTVGTPPMLASVRSPHHSAHPLADEPFNGSSTGTAACLRMPASKALLGNSGHNSNVSSGEKASAASGSTASSAHASHSGDADAARPADPLARRSHSSGSSSGRSGPGPLETAATVAPGPALPATSAAAVAQKVLAKVDVLASMVSHLRAATHVDATAGTGHEQGSRPGSEAAESEG